jgi:hypothetical protein
MKKVITRLAVAAAFAGAVPAAVAAQASNLTVHGYVTQGYASSQDAPLYGISEKGTADYRAMALQFRYATSPTDALVFQLSHRRLGASLIQATEPDIGLDWGFFQTQFAGNSVRVGKVPMPRGLYNEVRDVGTIFPFYRASKAFYSEGVETIDGLSIGRSFDFGGFSVDASAYAGEFDVKVELVTTSGLEVINSRVKKTAGAHVTVNTPITGFRINGDYLKGKSTSDGDWPLWTVGADLSKDRYFVRGEYEVVHTKDRDGSDNTEYLAWYSQAGFGITEKLWANWQYEFNSITAFGVLPSPPLASPDVKYDNIKDNAFGLSYKLSPRLLVKGEYHKFEGYQLDRATPPVNPANGQALPPGKAKYFILSLAAAF